jgi:hypothetical protein
MKFFSIFTVLTASISLFAIPIPETLYPTPERVPWIRGLLKKLRRT